MSCSLRALAGAFAAIAIAACAAQPDSSTPEAGKAASAIVGGAVDTTRPDVLLLRDDTLAGFRCTATLIAPNLVITARHCVGKRAVPAASTLCRAGATDEGAQLLPDYQGDVDAAPMYFSASPTSPTLARGVTVYDDGATTTCSHDLALIALDRNVAGITPSLLRLTPLAASDSLLAMGFGWTDRNATINADQRMSGTTSVLALGPVVYSFHPLGDPMATSQPVAIATGELAVQGITMTGDSGGPAFDSAGRLAALVSRGYSDAYYGPGTFTAIAAHLATIDAALVATGNAPIADAGSATPPDDAAVPAVDAGGISPVPTTSPADEAGVANEVAYSKPDSGCSIARASTGERFSIVAAALALAVMAIARRASRRVATSSPR